MDESMSEKMKAVKGRLESGLGNVFVDGNTSEDCGHDGGPRADQSENKCYPSFCRETAQSLLTRRIADLRREADELYALLIAVADLSKPVGTEVSPAEAGLYRILSHPPVW